MKKILPFLMILMVLFAFVACDNGNGGGDDGITSVDKEKETVAAAFADCTKPATEIVLSDGNWTVKVFMSDEAMGMWQVMTVKGTVADGTHTFSSGSEKATVDYAIMLKDQPEALEILKQLSDEEKTAMMSEIPEGASVEWDGLKVTMTVPLSEEDLVEMQAGMDFSDLPENAVVKTNADKTKYVIIIEDEDGYNEEYYISKD